MTKFNSSFDSADKDDSLVERNIVQNVRKQLKFIIVCNVLVELADSTQIDIAFICLDKFILPNKTATSPLHVFIDSGADQNMLSISWQTLLDLEYLWIFEHGVTLVDHKIFDLNYYRVTDERLRHLR